VKCDDYYCIKQDALGFVLGLRNGGFPTASVCNADLLIPIS
jgi:hypothetical protein